MADPDDFWGLTLIEKVAFWIVVLMVASIASISSTLAVLLYYT